MISNKGEDMDIQTVKEKDALVVNVKGRIDAVTAPEFEKRLADLIAAGEKVFLLNFSGLDYISSAGLRVILLTVKGLQAAQGKVVLSALTPYVREIFDVSNFSSIIPITDSVDAGLQQF